MKKVHKFSSQKNISLDTLNIAVGNNSMPQRQST